MASAKRKTPAKKSDGLERDAGRCHGDIAEGRVRAVIDAVLPTVDGGRFPAKRVAGEVVAIEAHCFTDGHDRLRVVLRWKLAGSANADFEVDMRRRATMCGRRNSRRRSRAATNAPSSRGWITSSPGAANLRRREDKSDIRVALEAGAALIDEAAARAAGSDAAILAEWSSQLRDSLKDAAADVTALRALALDPARAGYRRAGTRIEVWRQARRWISSSIASARPSAAGTNCFRARPRRKSGITENSATSRRGCHILRKWVSMCCIFRPSIPSAASIARARTMQLRAKPGDVGSPWAIGSAEGGHKDILPQLGTFEDFDRLLNVARALGIEIAMDIAFQCAPDHPYVKQHPQWFKHRPDGSVQYAENPPKKYQDIYPFDFETRDWRALWSELKSVVDFWIARGVKIFRVDNPHTKAFAFWEWLIGATKRDHPDVIYLAEAFTRPKVMHRLAKLGFSQSYTYFTWRNTKQELTDYFTELRQGPGRQYYRPNVWPNTPDILPETLQSGLRPMYAARLILAATLSSNYGIYGPTYELMESAPREPGSEEYRDSEKYQLRHWTLQRARQPLVADCAHEPHPAGKYCAAIGCRTAFLQDRQRSVDRLSEGRTRAART